MTTNDDSGLPSSTSAADAPATSLEVAVPSYPALPLDQDMPCANCQYDLRGLPADSMCPECATPIATSLAAFGWRGIDPLRPYQLRAGLLLIMMAWIASFLVSLLELLLRFYRFYYFPYWHNAFFELLSIGTAVAVWWAVQLIACPVTFQNQSAIDHPFARRLRVLNHASLLVTLVTRVVLTELTFLPTGFFRSYSVGVQVLAAIYTWFLFRWLAHVAAQIGRPRLARLGQVVAWLSGCSIVAFTVWPRILDYLDSMGIFSRHEILFLAIGGIVAAAFLGSLVTGFFNVLLLRRALSRLKRAVDPVAARAALIPALVRAAAKFLRKLPYYAGYHGPSTPSPPK
jgi:hypothetical protein